MASSKGLEEGLGLSIVGLARQYPPYSLKPDALEVLSKRFYSQTAV